MARHNRHKRETPDLAHLDKEIYSTWSHMDWITNGYPNGDPRIDRKPITPNKMGIPIPREFLNKFPNLPLHKAQEKWEAYLHEMRKVFLKRLPFLNDQITSVGTKKIRDNCGRFYPHGAKGDTYYVYNEFYPLYPFYAVTKTGSNLSGKNSEIVIVNQKLMDLLIDTADQHELVSICYGNLSEETLDDCSWVNIDLKSLENYIKSTGKRLETIDQNTEIEYYYKLLRSLRQAKYIKIITEFFGMNQFPMIKKISPYGRTYYEGLNLQNCHKEVRNAALGDNYQYDIEAAVYAIKLILINDIYMEQNKDLTGHYVYTKEYLDHKGHIRHKLAQHIKAYPDGLKLVKEALTAIGFGARISGGSWLEDDIIQYPAINNIIMNKNDRERFLTDPWVNEFYKEQKKLMTEITDYYKNKKGWCEYHLANLPRSTNKLGKYRKTAIMSYLFGKLETLIMEEITKNLDKDNILLILHDCIICEKPINGYDLQDIRHTLQSISEYLKISNEYNKGWLDIDTMSYEIDHKKFIIMEELKANNGIMPEKYTKFESKVVIQNDSVCYDGYDIGLKHEEYDSNDDSITDMTIDELREHHRIVGYNPNKLPDHIEKLLKK